MRKPQLKTGAMISSKVGSVGKGMSLIWLVIGAVILATVGGSVWLIFGNGLHNMTNEGICEQAGGFYNESATYDCETSAGSGVEQGNYYPNPLSGLLDPKNGVGMLIFGALILVGIFGYMKLKK